MESVLIILFYAIISMVNIMTQAQLKAEYNGFINILCTLQISGQQNAHNLVLFSCVSCTHWRDLDVFSPYGLLVAHGTAIIIVHLTTITTP